MLFSETVVNDLARVWTRLHRTAARGHLESMIQQLQRCGDIDGVANYSRVLAAVIAYRERRAALDEANMKIGLRLTP